MIALHVDKHDLNKRIKVWEISWTVHKIAIRHPLGKFQPCLLGGVRLRAIFCSTPEAVPRFCSDFRYKRGLELCNCRAFAQATWSRLRECPPHRCQRQAVEDGAPKMARRRWRAARLFLHLHSEFYCCTEITRPLCSWTNIILRKRPKCGLQKGPRL